MSYVVLDLETRESFQEIRAFDPSRLTISVAGLYDASTDEERAYRVEQLPELAEVLRRAPRVVGYNLLSFDYAVLKPAFAKASTSAKASVDRSAGPVVLPLDPYTLPTIDLFDHLQRVLGFRPKLDDVARATLGKGKSGNGLDAIRLYHEGKWDALTRYCLDDVRITKEIYEYGLQYGHVKFPMRDGTIADLKATWIAVPEQARMF